MGTLYMVPTPVGNLKDMTFRAIEVLQSVQTVLAEDTRVTGNLLKHYSIATKLFALHQNNEHRMVERMVERLAQGEDMAMVTDAGTPGISDPGFLLVREAVKAGVTVITLPGATAFVPALVNSGLPCDKFFFEGFLPQKKGRATRITAISELPCTVVLYESPHKLLKTLEQLKEACGSERGISASREISKLYEETVRGTLAEVIAHFTQHGVRGEFVLVLSGADAMNRVSTSNNES
jgi:16S rRNA (cytidine1402-2'-O)-methyltransferase